MKRRRKRAWLEVVSAFIPFLSVIKNGSHFLPRPLISYLSAKMATDPFCPTGPFCPTPPYNVSDIWIRDHDVRIYFMGLHGHGKIFHFAGTGHRRILELWGGSLLSRESENIVTILYKATFVLGKLWRHVSDKNYELLYSVKAHVPTYREGRKEMGMNGSCDLVDLGAFRLIRRSSEESTWSGVPMALQSNWSVYVYHACTIPACQAGKDELPELLAINMNIANDSIMITFHLSQKLVIKCFHRNLTGFQLQ